MALINYADKVALNSNSSVADVNKCNATDMNNLKNGVNINGGYTLATVGNQAGRVYITAPGVLQNGQSFKVLLPSPINPAQNVQFSVDGGATYYNLIRESNSSNVLVRYIAQQYAEIYFNGTAFVFKENISKELYSNASGTQGTITLSETIENFNSVEIIFGNASSTILSTGKMPVGKTIVLFYSNYESESSNYYATYKSENISISTTTVNRGEVYRGRIQIGSNAPTATAGTTIRPYIVKVIGYR